MSKKRQRRRKRKKIKYRRASRSRQLSLLHSGNLRSGHPPGAQDAEGLHQVMTVYDLVPLDSTLTIRGGPIVKTTVATVTVTVKAIAIVVTARAIVIMVAITKVVERFITTCFGTDTEYVCHSWQFWNAQIHQTSAAACIRWRIALFVMDLI